MTPRNTNPGGVLEAMILPALDRGGYRGAPRPLHPFTSVR
jgi:hypothetical protein